MVWEAWDKQDKAAMWFLGQSGFYIKSCGLTVVIDPYLSDSVGEDNPLYARLYPPPLLPQDLKADIYIVTHDHMDHLDPVTIQGYKWKDGTIFVAPRQAARKLKELGIQKKQIRVLDHGDLLELRNVSIEGVYALGTDENVLDTCGYRIQFANGKSVYHTSDTSFCDLLLRTAPKADVMLPCINGKFGNLTVEQAVRLAAACGANHLIPHHYDMMDLNGENPEAFRYFCGIQGIGHKCNILKTLEIFEW